MILGVDDGFTLRTVSRLTVSKSKVTAISASPTKNMIAAVVKATVYMLKGSELEEGRHWHISGHFKVWLKQ